MKVSIKRASVLLFLGLCGAGCLGIFAGDLLIESPLSGKSIEKQIVSTQNLYSSLKNNEVVVKAIEQLIKH